MKHNWQKMIILAGFMGALVGMSCLFDTRSAQPPGNNTGGGCTLGSPDKPFQCMKDAITNLQDADYERSLSDKFIFSPLPEDSLDQAFIGTDVYANWDKQREMDALRLLFSDAQQLAVDFTPTVLVNKNTFVRYRVPYTLAVVTKAAPTDTTRYKGVAEMYMQLENGNWRMTYWHEIESVPGYSTWGYLRGILGLRI